MSQQQYVYNKHGYPMSVSTNGGYSQYEDNNQLDTSPTFGQMYSISKMNSNNNNNNNSNNMGGDMSYQHEYLSSNSSPTDQHSLIPGSASSSISSSSGIPEYSFHVPRLRYFLSKSFEIEDDLEFCPAIPENFNQLQLQLLLQLNTTQVSPQPKKFNPYTASVFSPTSSAKESVTSSTPPTSATSPRVHTPRIRKPIEIINPQTRMRISSPALSTK